MIATAIAFSRLSRVIGVQFKAINLENTDLATNYLGYWMDNGAYYYYNPLPSTSYQDTVLELHANLTERIPVR